MVVDELVCPECSRVVPGDASTQGLCPECLLRCALDELEDTREPEYATAGRQPLAGRRVGQRLDRAARVIHLRPGRRRNVASQLHARGPASGGFDVYLQQARLGAKTGGRRVSSVIRLEDPRLRTPSRNERALGKDKRA